MRYLGIAGLTFLVLLFGDTSLKAKIIDGVVAVVNNDIILYSDLQQKLHEFMKENPGAVDSAHLRELRREILGQMVRNLLVEQEVKRLGIKVSSSDVDRAVESICKQNGLSSEQLEDVLKSRGQSIDAFREEIRREIERSRLIEQALKKKIVITDDQVMAYLRKHSSSTTERWHLAAIFLPCPNNKAGAEDIAKLASEIKKRIDKGEDFGKLAREYSEGPGAVSGGDIGYVSIEELAPPLRATVQALGPGKCSDPIRTSSGFYIIKVLDKRRMGLSRVNGQLKEQVRRKLFKEELNRRFNDWIKDLVSKSYIQINLKDFPLDAGA